MIENQEENRESCKNIEWIRRLGQGGECAVYLVKWHDQKENQTRFCAAKFVREDLSEQATYEARRRLVAEAELLRNLQIDGIPQFYALVWKEETPILLEEYVEGNSPGSLVGTDSEWRGECRKVLLLAMQCCNILTELHSHDPPIVYGDLKPSNMIVTSKGHLMLVDFGACVTISDQEREGDFPLMGTPGYAPLESVSQDSSKDALFDVDMYGLGATMHAILSGEDPVETGLVPIGHFLPALTGSRIERVIAKCCNSGRLLRYQNVHELKKDLRLCLRKERIRIWKNRLRSRTMWLLAACLLIWLRGCAADVQTVKMYHETLQSAVNVSDFSLKKQYYDEAFSLKPYSGEAYLRLLCDAIADGQITTEEIELIKGCLYGSDVSNSQTLSRLEQLKWGNPKMFGTISLQLGWLYLKAVGYGTEEAKAYFDKALSSGALSDKEKRSAQTGILVAHSIEQSNGSFHEEEKWRSLWEQLDCFIGKDVFLEVRCGDWHAALALCREMARHCLWDEDALLLSGVTREERRMKLSLADKFLARAKTCGNPEIQKEAESIEKELKLAR